MSSSDDDIKQPLNKNFREPKIRFPNYVGQSLNSCALNRMADVSRGGSPRPINAYITDNIDGINWIRISDASDDGYIYHTEEKILKSGIKKSFLIQPGDLLLSNSMSFGHTYISKISGCIHDGWLSIRPYANKLDSEFLKYYLSSPICKRKFLSLAAGGVVSNLNKEIVGKINIAFPTKQEQEKIAQLFNAMDHNIALLQHKSDALKKYKLGFINNWFEMCGNRVLLSNLVTQKPSGLLTSHFKEGSGNFPVYDASGLPYTSINFYNTESDSVSIIKYGSGCGRTFLTHGLHSVLGTMNELIPHKSDELYYIYAYTLSDSFKKICKKYTEIGTTPNLYYSDYSLAQVYYPEKDKINEFTQVFVTFEKLEKLLNSDLKILSYLKSFLLNNMFI